MKYALYLFLLAVSACLPAHAQDTIRARWSYDVPTTIRHTSVRGERIGIALDSTVIVIDRSSGTEIVRFATHRGVIEGIGLMPGDTTCVVVSASHDTAQKMIVNAVAEIDMRTGEELRTLTLPMLSGQAWRPRYVETKCAFTHDGRWLYTTTPQYYNSNGSHVERGRYYTVNLTDFTVEPTGTGTGPYGHIEVSSDDHLLLYYGETGSPPTNPRDNQWRSTSHGMVRIVRDTGTYWKVLDRRLQIAPHARYCYYRPFLYDTATFTPTELPILYETINMLALCHNGRNYFSAPRMDTSGFTSITIRELGSNLVVHELELDSVDHTYRWLIGVDDTTFTIAQDRRVISWPIKLAPELPPTIVHALPDTIVERTCYVTSPYALPIAAGLELVASASGGSIGNGTLQFTTAGTKTISYTVLWNGQTMVTNERQVDVGPWSHHPLARWGMRVDVSPKSYDTAYAPRLSPDGTYAAFLNQTMLAVGATDNSVLTARSFQYGHSVRGATVTSDGTATTVRDSVGRKNSDGRTFYNTQRHLFFDGLTLGGQSMPRTQRSYQSDQNVSVSVHTNPPWDADHGWRLVLLAVPMNDSYFYSTTTLDIATNTKVLFDIPADHMPIAFDRDPITGKPWWIGQPPNSYSHRTTTTINAYSPDDGGIRDHGRFPLIRQLFFVANGAFLYGDGRLYDRDWRKVGPDTTQPLFSGAFLGNRPYAIHVVRKTDSTPCFLQLRRLPDGVVIDTFAFDEQITGVATDVKGTTIAITFRDASLHVFYTGKLFPRLPIVVSTGEEQPTTYPSSGKGLVVAPHPVSDVATIFIERWNQEPLTYLISDLQGVEIVHARVPEGANHVMWDRHDDASQRVSAGMYVLSITDGLTVRRSLIILE